MTLIDAKYNKSEEIASRDVLGWIHKKEWKSIELPKVASRLSSEIYTTNLKFKDE